MPDRLPEPRIGCGALLPWVRVIVLSPLVSKYIQLEYESLSKRYRFETATGLHKWLLEEQNAPLHDAALLRNGSFQCFAEYLSSVHSDAMKPADRVDESHPISDYFISSSHHTYLTGNQLSSDASIDAYKNVLLRAGRCVEIDVWDGEPDSRSDSEDGPFQTATDPQENKAIPGFRQRLALRLGWKGSPPKETPLTPPPLPASEGARIEPWQPYYASAEPRVLRGYTLTKETSFRSVCATIRDYAFKASLLPLIVSLNVHAGSTQQEIMVNIIREYWLGMLVILPLESAQPADELKLPALGELYRKILLDVKYTPPRAPEEIAKPTTLQVPTLEGTRNSSTGSITYSNPSSSMSELPKGEVKPPTPRAKQIEALGRLGVYTRRYDFKTFDQPEAKIPTHVFSLSERSLMEVHETQPEELFNHNRKFFMRVYPKRSRFDSSNFEPSVFWRTGVQIAALNWQRWDTGMMLNEAMFAGSGGWVLKPEGYCSSSNHSHQQIASVRCKFNLSIEFFAGQDIPLPLERDDPRHLRPFIKVQLHTQDLEEENSEPIPGGGRARGSRTRGGEYKRRTKTARTTNPDFSREVIKFQSVRTVTRELTFVSFEVRDGDYLAAWACFRLDRLQTGLRMIHLFDTNGIVTRGALLVQIKKAVSIM